MKSTCKNWLASAAIAGLMFASPAFANDPAVDAQIRELQQQVAELQAQNGDNWLNERRAEEIKGLIHEVLADAETRASFAEGGLTAGHTGKNFYLSSEDGNFHLILKGQLQVRYIVNRRDGDNSSIDEIENGFQIRRAKFQGKGHIFDPKLKYAFSFAADRGREEVLEDGEVVEDGDSFSFSGDSTDIKQIEFEDYYLEYEFADGWNVRAGRFKQPFARENLVSSSKQTVMERSSVHEAFRVDRSEGIQVSYEADAWRTFLAFNDGQREEVTDFDQEAAHWAVTGRAEYLAMGNWKQFGDFSSWSGDDAGLLFGAAFHYQKGEHGTGNVIEDFFKWTGDVSYEANGLSLFASGYGLHFDDDEGTSDSDTDHYGMNLTAAYMVIPDKFEPYVRFEWIIIDDDHPVVAADGGEDSIHIATAGFNWYHHKHNAKFTADVVWAMDPLYDFFGGGSSARSSGLGLRKDGTNESDDQFALRLQYQILF